MFSKNWARPYKCSSNSFPANGVPVTTTLPVPETCLKGFRAKLRAKWSSKRPVVDAPKCPVVDASVGFGSLSALGIGSVKPTKFRRSFWRRLLLRRTEPAPLTVDELISLLKAKRYSEEIEAKLAASLKVEKKAEKKAEKPVAIEYRRLEDLKIVEIDLLPYASRLKNFEMDFEKLQADFPQPGALKPLRKHKKGGYPDYPLMLKLEKLSDGSLIWDKCHRAQLQDSVLPLEVLPKGAFKPDIWFKVLALVGHLPMPAYTSLIPEIKHLLTDPGKYTMLQAFNVAHAVKDDVLKTLIKNIARREYNDRKGSSQNASTDAPRPPSSPGDDLGAFLKVDGLLPATELDPLVGVSPMSPPDSRCLILPLFLPGTLSLPPLFPDEPVILPLLLPEEPMTLPPVLPDDLDLPTAPLLVETKEERRLEPLPDRFQRKSFRERWREDRKAREVERETRRKIKLETRKLTLLETEKLLSEMKLLVLEAMHKKTQEEKDHELAEYNRQHEAKLSNQKRKLEFLEHQLIMAESDKRLKLIFLRLWRKNEKANAEVLDLMKTESVFPDTKVSPQASVFSKDGASCRSFSISPEGLKRNSTTVSPPKFCDDREMEENPWDVGGEAGLRRYLAKKKPVLGVMSVPKDSEIDEEFRPPTNASAGNQIFSVDDYLPAEPPKPEADFVFHSCPVPRPDAPPPARATGTPFWKKEAYIQRRKELKKPKYAAAVEELVAAKSVLNKIPFAWDC